jgi:superfamily I DNA and/or RNA helicase
VAVSQAAKNIVLIGDQMQLDQPIQGAHPGDSGDSALEFMLGDHAVISEDRGIFLERSYRMHPDVCKPLSDIVYEGKLKTAPNNQRIAIEIPEPELITSTTGVLSIPVSHEGNRQSSEEEADVVQTLINEITTGQFTDSDGVTKKLTTADILVVAPYNMQVNLLKEKLGGDIKVGTIDKFQGQEAAVVIVSLGTSDASESARGLDFVFDINRLNVAISRAKALAIVVANEGLHLCRISTTAQMGKVNLFCRLINDGSREDHITRPPQQRANSPDNKQRIIL